jgi:hypothetical protein
MRGLLIVVVVLVVGVIGLGFYLNWFNLTVDRDKIASDVNIAKKTLIGHSDEKTGMVKSVEGAEKRFTLATTGSPDMVVLWAGETKVKVGDEVTVRLRDKGGNHEATSVTIVQR